MTEPASNTVDDGDQPRLVIEDVQAGYGKARVLHHVSLDLHPGQICCVIGPNGAGKTTLLKAIAGLVPTLAGTVRLDGVHLQGTSASQRVQHGISYVPQGGRVFSSLTVEENVVLGAYRFSRRARADAIAAGLAASYELFPILSERRKQTAGSLSGGQRQMLAVARALMAQPTVLLLDEPSIGLAPVVVKEMMSAVEQLVRGRLSVVLVEQRMEVALGLASSAHVLSAGRIAFSADGAWARDNPEVLREYYFGAGDPAQTA
jgi:branched-chain amino acid transport system ATP-binding protein